MYTIGLLYILYALNKTQLEPEDCPLKNHFPNHFLLVCVRFKGAEHYQSLVDGSIGSNVEILWEPGANNGYSFVVSTYSILSQNITLYNGHKIFQTSFCGGFMLVLRWVFYITLPAQHWLTLILCTADRCSAATCCLGHTATAIRCKNSSLCL